jgi:hypothetical protein
MDDIKQTIRDEIVKYMDESRFGVTNIPAHSHTGMESNQVSFSDLIPAPVISAVPTDTPANGTMRLYNAGGTRKIYAFIAGVWYSVALL